MNGQRNAVPRVFWIAAAMLVLFFSYPVIGLLGGVGWGRLQEAWGDPLVKQAVWVSLKTSTAATLLMGVLGIPVGYLLARSNFPGRAVVTALMYLPLMLPPLVGGILLLAVYGPYSAVGQWLAHWNISLTGSLPAIVAAQMFVAAPYVVITARASFLAVDPEMELIAETLGDSRWQAFRRIAVPLAWRGLTAGLALAWVRSLGEFGATLVVAYTPHTLPIWLWAVLTSAGLQAALPLALLLLLLGMAALAAVALLGELRAGVPHAGAFGGKP
jgi:molybdate/tungstate transport system permease protein